MIPQGIKFDNNKFKEAILFLLSQSPNKTIEGKKKLAKLLYFADFNYFEAYEEPLTGATYRALPMGPVPDELEGAIKEMKEKQCIEPKAAMKTTHMKILDQWRNDVVRGPYNRLYTAADGKTYDMSLQNGCMKCHSNKTQFRENKKEKAVNGLKR